MPNTHPGAGVGVHQARRAQALRSFQKEKISINKKTWYLWAIFESLFEHFNSYTASKFVSFYEINYNNFIVVSRPWTEESFEPRELIRTLCSCNCFF